MKLIMNLLKKNKLKNFNDSRGKLFFYQQNKFLSQRVFFIEGNKDKIRGNHAHKETKQILININSKTKIEIINSNKKIINFFKPGEYIEVPKMSWVRIYFKKKGYIAVLCDKKYYKNDYIHDYEKFLKLKKKAFI